MISLKSPTANQRQRWKAALIPLLGLVLVAVLLWPEPIERPAASDARSAVATRSPAALVSASSAIESASEGDRWPQVELEAITAVNPFVRPPAIQRLLDKPVKPKDVEVSGSSNGDPQPPQTASSTTVSAAEPPPVDDVKLQAILASDGGRTALIDSQIVRPGQLLPNGYRVVDITPTALVLEYIAPDGQPQPAVTRSLP